jgi:hypothetical protein
MVWRWQERFMHEGVEGLTREKTRPPRIPLLPAETIDRLDRPLSSDPAVLPESEPISQSPTGDVANTVPSYYGCATATNLCLMVASPADLVSGRPFTEPDAAAEAAEQLVVRRARVVPDRERRYASRRRLASTG